MNSPNNIVLARHSQSVGNWVRQEEIAGLEEGRHTEEYEARLGRKLELTQPRGLEQAIALGGLIESLGLEFDAYFTSPATRAIATAKGMNLPGAKWQIERRVRERDYGVIELMSTQQYREEFPRNARLREQDPLYWRPPSGESTVEVVDRFAIFLQFLHEEYAGANVLVVTHGDLMWAAMCGLESLTDDEWDARYRDEHFRIRNTTVYQYSRVNPEDATVDPIINWVRRMHPEDKVAATWEALRPETFTNEELHP